MRVALANLSMPHLDLDRVASLANEVQSMFVFGKWPEPECSLAITEVPLPGLFDCTPPVPSVSLWHSDGLCRFARLEESEFLVICGVLALTCFRMLEQNEYMRFEDVYFDCDPECVANTTIGRPDCTRPLDHLSVCRRCCDFYGCMGAERELEALIGTLEEISSRREKRSVQRWAEKGMERPPIY